jgi:two-component system cell cycle sensor histidine kinase/response regulator CckA
MVWLGLSQGLRRAELSPDGFLALPSAGARRHNVGKNYPAPEDQGGLGHWWLLGLLVLLISIAFLFGLSLAQLPEAGGWVALAVGGLLGLTALTVLLWTMRRLRSGMAQRVQSAEAKYRLLLESTGDGIVGLSCDARILFINPAGAALLGYRQDELLGQQLHDLMHHTRKDGTPCASHECPVVHALEAGETCQLGAELLWRSDGTNFVAACALFPVREDGKLTGAVMSVSDITAQKQAEEELRESEERYRKLLSATFEAIVIHNDEGVVLEVNHAFEVMFGVPGMLATGLPILAFLAEETRELFLSQIREGTESPYDGIGLRMDGKLFNIELITKAHTYKGEPIRMTAMRDITVRKRVEYRQRVQLAISQILVEARTLHEAIPDLLQAICETMEWDVGNLWLVDREAQALRWVTQWRIPGLETEVFSAATHEVIVKRGEGLPGQVWVSRQPTWIQDFSQEVSGAKDSIAVDQGLCAAFAFPIVSGADMYGVVECFSREIRQPDHDVFEMMTDIGIKIGQFLERKRGEEALRESEQQLRQAVKLEAIGQLAGGIAHDFNNVLTVITGYSSMLQSTVDASSISHSALMEILKAANRAAALTHQLLAFSRRQVLQPRLLDLNSVVASIEHLLRRLIGEDIELITIQAPALGTVRADPGQLEQVIMNTAVNARDAMPEGGKLTIATANLELPDLAHSKSHQMPPGSYVTLTISDTGFGMDAETQARIFEPFFTTKEKGRGTGLGLSTVYGIVEQSGGHVEVTSAPGHGAVFTMYFPRVAGVGQAIEPETPLLGPVGGSETILLVEDDPTVRNLLYQVLQRYGYTVLAAPHPDDALAFSGRHRGLIHLMLTDVVMPVMSGGELASRVRGHRPEMRVLYMSGYTENAKDLPELWDAESAFIQKPFSPEILAHKVREILDIPPTSAPHRVQ